MSDTEKSPEERIKELEAQIEAMKPKDPRTIRAFEIAPQQRDLLITYLGDRGATANDLIHMLTRQLKPLYAEMPADPKPTAEPNRKQRRASQSKSKQAKQKRAAAKANGAEQPTAH